MSSAAPIRVLPFAIRSLTQEFLHMRENSRQRRGLAPRSALEEKLNPEDEHMRTMPPIWVESVNSIKTDLALIREKDAELARLHQARLKVVFDDNQTKSLDRDIELYTDAISKLFRKCQNNVKRVALLGNDGALSAADRNIRYNVMRALGSKVHELSAAFRERQKEYLVRMKEVSHGVHMFDDYRAEEKGLVDYLDQGFSEDQLLKLEQAEQSANERERQIAQIARSVIELAQLFHEMSVLVTEQGTILDRVDYNVEHALVDIKAGKAEVEEAEEWQKSSRSWLCIAAIMLCVILITVIAILQYQAKH